MQLKDRAGEGRGHLDDGLVRLDLAQRLVDLDLIALLDGPADDLALGDPFTDVRKPELFGHVQNSISRRMPRRTRSGFG